jgi:hypothetical protein
MLVPMLTSFLAALLGRKPHFSTLERLILDCIKRHLDARTADLWDRQAQAVNRIQRLPGGVEVNFYRMQKGRPYSDSRLAFTNKAPELLVATVCIETPDFQQELNAKAWCVKGFLFSIEYEGNAAYFDEAADLDPKPRFVVTCELVSALEKP